MATERRDLEEAVQDLRVGSGRWSVSERTLLVAGGVLVPVGLLVVLLGWFGAARTPNVHEQIPYLISGGLLGLGLVVIGGFLYFAHWVTELVREQRAGTAVLLDALERLAEAEERRGRAPEEPAPGPSQAGAGAPGPALVATATGTMAHRPDCRVVAGRLGVRSVGASEHLVACRVCRPLG